MTAAAAAARGRRMAESLMTSTCTIREPSAGKTTDPDTGEVTDVPGATVYSGKCRVRPNVSRGGGTTEAGGAQLFAFDYVISVPFAVTAVAEGQELTVDTSADPALAGVTVLVSKVDRGEHITARRLSCSDTIDRKAAV